MSRRRPPCGNLDAHPAHEYGDVYDANTNQHWPKTCPGWPELLAAATVIADQIDAAVLAWWQERPPGPQPRLRLECHASVISALRELSEPDFPEFTPTGLYGEVPPLAYADVIVLPLPSGEWRLAGPGTVLASGSLGTATRP